MSAINAAQTTQTAQSAASQTSESKRSGSEAFVGEEFNNFLKLLTAQLRHQDPLSPLDSTQFVDQLVSCSPATMSGFYRDIMGHERTAGLKAFDGVPTTVMVGSADVLTPPAHARPRPCFMYARVLNGSDGLLCRRIDRNARRVP